MKKLENKKCVFLAVFFLISFLQAKDSPEQLNFIVLESSIIFKKEIGSLFEKEISLLCRKHRFEFFLAILKSNLFFLTDEM